MLKHTLTFITGALALSIGVALASEPAAAPQPAKEQVYGNQMMTPQERAEHRTKMRAAKTAEEKAQVRSEEHARMKERAEQQGKVMPENPPARGGGMGPGPAAGGGGRNR